MKFKCLHAFLLLFACSVLIAIGCFSKGVVYAHEPYEDVVYFIDGTVVKGKITRISRQIIQIKQADGTIIERPVMFLYRFSSKRHFTEIYDRAVEYGDKDFWNRREN
jgi:hypothetical protein